MALPELGLQQWALFLASIAVACFFAWGFWFEGRRLAKEVAPAAEAMSYAELRSALRVVEDSGGTIFHDESEHPIGEAAAFRAISEGWLRSFTMGGPWSTTEVLELTKEGREFLNLRDRAA